MDDTSLTLTLSGTSSSLETYYFPPIELKYPYVLGLTELLTFDSIPNIDCTNNLIHLGDFIGELPTGSYEISDINSYIQKLFSPYKISF